MSYIGRGIDSIDNISTLDNLSFNGSDATFNLTQNSVAFVPVSADALQIQIDGVIQSGNYTVSGSTVTFDFTPSGSSVCNGIKHFGVGVLTTVSDGAVTSAKLGNNSVGITQLNVSDGSNGQALTTNGSGTLAFSTISGTTINNNADNRVITGSGTANTLEGEANLTYNGTILGVGGTGDLGTGVHVRTSDTGGTVSANSDNLVLEENGNVGLTMLSATNGGGHIFFGHSGDQDEGFLTYDCDNNRMRFGVNGAEGMRLLGTGVLAIGTTSASCSPSTSCLELKGTEAPLSIINETAVDSGDRTSIALRNASGTLVGNVGVDSSSAQFNTSSDYRLKENEVAISDGIERLKQLKPYRFNFKTDTDKTVDGFFAHEVSSIVPEAITGTKDATETYTDDNGDEQTRIKPQSIDQSKLVPLLTSALQEAITKIETLEARVQALENA